MELSKYKLNRIKAHAIENIGGTISSYIESMQEQVATSQTAYDELMAENPDEWDWRIDDRIESLKQAEITLSIWKDLQTALDKMLCK